MARAQLIRHEEGLIAAAQSLATQEGASAVVMLSERSYNFRDIQNGLGELRLVVASDKEDVIETAKKDDVNYVPLLEEPETRQLQLISALLEAIAELGLIASDVCRQLHDAYFAYRAELHRTSLQQIDGLTDNQNFRDQRAKVERAWRELFNR